ncbi:ABC transporter ATP-binding protein/permease [soil metagenome]
MKHLLKASLTWLLTALIAVITFPFRVAKAIALWIAAKAKSPLAWFVGKAEQPARRLFAKFQAFVERWAKWIFIGISIIATLAVGNWANIEHGLLNDVAAYVVHQVSPALGEPAWLLVMLGSPFLLWIPIFLIGRYIIRRVSKTAVWKIGAGYWTSKETRWKAGAFIAFLLIGLAAVNYLNVVISFTGRDFYEALQSKNEPVFWLNFSRYATVLLVATPIIVFYAWIKSRLTLSWRIWLTNTLVGKFMANHNYYRLVNEAQQVDNVDERLTNDADAFPSAALSIFMAVIDATATLFTYAAILYLIAPVLVLAAIVYAGIGTAISLLFGRQFSILNYLQAKLEANFRYSLVRVRDNTEQIALYHGEEQEKFQVLVAFKEAWQNIRRVIGLNFLFSLFSTPYGFFINLVPAGVLATLWFAGKIEFGQFIQASTAFSAVLGSLTIVVDNIKGLASFKANIDRLYPFTEKLDADSYTVGQISFAHVTNAAVEITKGTITTPDGAQTLVKDLNFLAQEGSSTLVVGSSGVGKSSLIRTIAELWTGGSGKIISPDADNVLTLPQKPYMPLGNLRHQLEYGHTTKLTDSAARAVLAKFNLADLPDRFEGGFDAVTNWSTVLSLGEQQRLAFARAWLAIGKANKPMLIMLDEATSALDTANERAMYEIIKNTGATVISVGHRPTLVPFHTTVLQLNGNGGWETYPAEFYKARHPEIA